MLSKLKNDLILPKKRDYSVLWRLMKKVTDIYTFKILNAKGKNSKKASAGKEQVILHEFRVIQTDLSLVYLESRMWDSFS